MRLRVLISTVLLMLSASVLLAQDRDLMLGAAFTPEAPQPSADSTTVAERVAGAIGKQLGSRGFYDPPTYLFFRKAVNSLGFFGGSLATVDRILRASRIGTATSAVPAGPNGIAEGPEAYLPRHKEIKILPQKPAAPAAQAHAFKSIGPDYEFVEYLIDNDLKKDALKLVSDPGYIASDTLIFLRGWVNYQLKELEKAAGYLTAVPDGSPFKEKALFYSTAVSAHMGDYSSPVRALEAYSGPYAELKGVQLAGLALLRDDPESFKAAAQAFEYKDYNLAPVETELDQIFAQRFEQKGKSPVLAAAASALVPGLGRIYAGNTGEGISSLLLIGATGAITAEHWIKDGPADWKTILPGIITAVLYIGNIYGSYMSVSIYNNNLRNAQDTAILYNIHIPLRSVFK
ncbi:MAG: hypothetical protein J6O51_05965 [Bacteroidales bacterium]|nr:hypothetical protein [Bacteroidales bacterium]